MRSAAPIVLKRAGRKAAISIGLVSTRWRLNPSFLLVGAQRCGTTSLFRALSAHPSIVTANFHKGVNYFDVNYQRGPDWYRAHFPIRRRRPRQCFDASGYYMFHPYAPRRIAHDLPRVKIVAMVRDPVERAYSAYQHEYARGFESESFARALELEAQRVEPELARMQVDEGYQSMAHRHQAYRRRGHYAEQLQCFVDLMGRSQVHVMESERFFAEPEQEYTRLLKFLGAPVQIPARFDRHNPRSRAPMEDSVRAELTDYFAAHDQRLSELLGRAPVWRT
ncbi:MAG: sulfotransferase domain-containing protein [Actinomycetota bacterium]|nr:sulfotransferase domain-containing protein [Actinomycetota bacterium]